MTATFREAIPLGSSESFDALDAFEIFNATGIPVGGVFKVAAWGVKSAWNKYTKYTGAPELKAAMAEHFSIEFTLARAPKQMSFLRERIKAEESELQQRTGLSRLFRWESRGKVARLDRQLAWDRNALLRVEERLDHARRTKPHAEERVRKAFAQLRGPTAARAESLEAAYREQLLVISDHLNLEAARGSHRYESLALRS